MSKKAALLINLGSPDSTDPKDVRRYLDEFLMDERVIDLNPLARKLLVQGIILNTRPKKSAAAYQSIWWDEGSPLIVLSQRLHEKVSAKSEIPTALAMRYGNPSIHAGIEKLVAENPALEEVFVIPLYPQFAMSTVETVMEKVNEVVTAHFPSLKIAQLPPFYNHPDYIAILAESMREHIAADVDHVLFSYHGVPERHIKKSDITGKHCFKTGNCCRVKSPAHAFCYRHQCFITTDLVAQKLGLAPDQYSVTFQSRLGIDPWLTPFTDKTIKSFGEIGMKKLAIACPAFVSDCLETLEEIAEEGKEIFHEAGGGDFHMIPCLNDRDDWAQLLGNWINAFANKSVSAVV
ncbi:MAG: ferrochelatase [Schleiferiaceae bacterium]|nr:ferrochelatase [Schleiferiaceae bacterium]